MSHSDIMKTPILQKAMDLVQMVLSLKEFINTEDEHSKDSINVMIQDAMQIPPKLATAMAAGRYDIQMENAAIIKNCTKKVIVNTQPFWGISQHIDEFLLLLRNEVDEFKILFLEWVEGLNS